MEQESLLFQRRDTNGYISIPSEKQLKYWKSKIGTKQSQETISKKNEKLKKVIHTQDWNNKVRESKLREKNPMWNGGHYKTEYGYIFIKCQNHPFARKDNYYQEHRLVAESVIGRYLTKEEKIHHIDKNRQNNSPNNLILFPNDREHHKFHQKIRQFGMTQPRRTEIFNNIIQVKLREQNE